uniref:Putative secreted protein n=1 Tax=Anopheles darlingi TaxID=43151 RepID=A0A2M4D930_ANODA
MVCTCGWPRSYLRTIWLSFPTAALSIVVPWHVPSRHIWPPVRSTILPTPAREPFCRSRAYRTPWQSTPAHKLRLPPVLPRRWRSVVSVPPCTS